MIERRRTAALEREFHVADRRLVVRRRRDREHPKILAEIGFVAGARIDVGEVRIVAAQQEELGRQARDVLPGMLIAAPRV